MGVLTEFIDGLMGKTVTPMVEKMKPSQFNDWPRNEAIATNKETMGIGYEDINSDLLPHEANENFPIKLPHAAFMREYTGQNPFENPTVIENPLTKLWDAEKPKGEPSLTGEIIPPKGSANVGQDVSQTTSELPYTFHPNADWIDKLKDTFGLKGVSAGSDYGYQQLEDALGQLGIAIGLPKNSMEDFKAIGSNRLIPIKDYNFTGEHEQIGGMFWRDYNGEKVIGLPADLLEISKEKWGWPQNPNKAAITSANSVAHEWWHYFDNYMSQEFGIRNWEANPNPELNFASQYEGKGYVGKARPEVQKAWEQLNTLINDPNNTFYHFSAYRDLLRDTPYWNTPIEKGARMFEDWASHKWGPNLPEGSILVDKPEVYEGAGIYPSGATYDPLTKKAATEYRDKVYAAFDNLFDTLKPEKTTDAQGNTYWRLAALGGFGVAGVGAMAGKAEAKELNPLDPDYINQYYNKVYGVPLMSPTTQQMLKQPPVNNLLLTVEGFNKKGWVVPNAPKGGVNVGMGVDLGQFDEAELRRIGVAEDTISAVKPYLGLKQAQASKLLAKQGLVLSQNQAEALSQKIFTAKNQELRTRFNKDSVLDFDSLPKPAQDVLMSMWYQWGNLAMRQPTFWRTMTQGDFKGAIGQLRSFSEYKKRRGMEADLLQSIAVGE